MTINFINHCKLLINMGDITTRLCAKLDIARLQECWEMAGRELD